MIARIYPNAILIFFFLFQISFFGEETNVFHQKPASKTSLLIIPLFSINTAGSCLPGGKLIAGNWGSPLNWHFFPRAKKEHCLACWELLVPSPSSLDSPFLGLRLTMTGPGRGALCPGLGLQLQGPRALCALWARMKVCSQPDISLI